MKKIILTAVVAGLLPAPSLTWAASQSSGLTLLSPAGARALALGEAITAAAGTIDALRANPALVSSLDGGEATLYYNRGALEDHYGQVMLGRSVEWGGLGLGVNYYDGGDLFSYDTGAERRLTAQRDVAVTVGQSLRWGNFSVGIAEKYLRSELVERDASAFALDLGLQTQLFSRFHLGAAVQNIGTKLKYDRKREPLPRLARGGFSAVVIPGRTSLRWLADVVYLMDDGETQAGTGLELLIGPVALRGGYVNGKELRRLSAGVGVRVARVSIDYGLGLIDDLNSQHLVSFSTRFGSSSAQ